jgi:hypothetical protein
MMIRVSKIIDATPSKVWAELTDWNNHARWIPMTKILNPHNLVFVGKVGEIFIGRTGLGLFAFNDEMRVTSSYPPVNLPVGVQTFKTSLEVAKMGNVVKGKAGFILEPIECFGLDGSKKVKTKLVWWEDITVFNDSFQKMFNFMLEPVVNIAFKKSVDKIAKDIESKSK